MGRLEGPIMDSTTADSDAVLTVAEVMDRLHLGRKYVLTEIARGNLKAKKFGNRGGYRIRVQDYHTWLTTPSESQNRAQSARRVLQCVTDEPDAPADEQEAET
jgi:excisionase family DNA binding protein